MKKKTTPPVASVTVAPPPLPPPEWLTALVARHGKPAVASAMQQIQLEREQRALRDALFSLSPEQLREALTKWLQ